MPMSLGLLAPYHLVIPLEGIYYWSVVVLTVSLLMFACLIHHFLPFSTLGFHFLHPSLLWPSNLHTLQYIDRESYRTFTYTISSNPVFSSTFIMHTVLGSSEAKSNYTFTLTQIGLVLFIVAKSIHKGFPTIKDREKSDSFMKYIGNKLRKDIHSTTWFVSSSILESVFSMSSCIWYSQPSLPLMY